MTNSQTIQWKRLAVEGTAIVASILLAFGIDAAWDDRQEQRQERIFLTSLLADFIDSRDRIQAALSDHDSYRQSAIQLLDIADARAAGIDPATVETALLHVFHNAKTLNTSNGSLDSLLASGRLATIRNDQLRALLASWPSRIADAAEDEVWILVDMQERAIPYLNSAVATRNILARDPRVANYISAASSSDYGALWDDRVFVNLVLYRIHSEIVVITEITELLNGAERIINLIESELTRQ